MEQQNQSYFKNITFFKNLRFLIGGATEPAILEIMYRGVKLRHKYKSSLFSRLLGLSNSDNEDGMYLKTFAKSGGYHDDFR